MRKIKSLLFIALFTVVLIPKVKAQGPIWIVDLDNYFNHEFHKTLMGKWSASIICGR